MKTYLITGGAGFIGANFLKYKLKQNKKENIYIILDKLTYAGNLRTIQKELLNYQVKFIKGDICNKELVEKIFVNYNIDYVVNFAAESHVDRSIENPIIFIETNILGTQTLLDVAKRHWTSSKNEKGYPVYKVGKKFLQVSTDEVYGTLSRDFPEGKELLTVDENITESLRSHRIIPKIFGKKFFTEETSLAPRSPYAVSKAGADMLVKAYAKTYHLPVNITRCGNNYGPYQFPEKLIPLIIKNILEGKKLPVYGDGKQVRDWLYVDDHCKGIDIVINKGRLFETYNVGGFNEEQNINIVKLIIDTIVKIVNEEPKYQEILKTDLSNINYDLITHVQDRLGHDARYAIDPSKIIKELGFYPETELIVGIEKTVRWHLENQEWVEEVVSEDHVKQCEIVINSNN